MLPIKQFLKAFLKLNGIILAVSVIVVLGSVAINDFFYGAFPKTQPTGFVYGSLEIINGFTVLLGGNFLIAQWYTYPLLTSYKWRWLVVLVLFILGLPSTLYPAAWAYFLYWPSDPTTFTKEIAEAESWRWVAIVAACSLFWAFVVVYKPHKLLWQKAKTLLR